MNTKNDIKKIIEILKNTYPDAKCSLDFNTPFKLLVSVMLSAQCTDERVNKTTPELFKKYPTPKDMANATFSDLEKIIHPCGFYKVKSKHLINCSKILQENYNGEVPNSLNELIKLPGIGRKCANVILLNAFNLPVGIAVDTHAKRVSNRLGLSANTDPNKIEQDLLNLVPKKNIRDVNHLFVYHGRNFCTAKNPHCLSCPLKKLCKNKPQV